MTSSTPSIALSVMPARNDLLRMVRICGFIGESIAAYHILGPRASAEYFPFELSGRDPRWAG